MMQWVLRPPVLRAALHGAQSDARQPDPIGLGAALVNLPVREAAIQRPGASGQPQGA